MSNYKLIQDEDKLDKFINILSETNDNTRFYINLIARKKYDSTGIVKHDNAQVKRVLSRKEQIKDKIRQMEVAIGAYSIDNKAIPEESLALYITCNTRNLHKAGLKMLKEMSDKIYHNNSINTHTLSLSCIQRTSAEKRFFDVDIDYIRDKHGSISDYKVINIAKEAIGDTFNIILTRGGLHLLVKLDDTNLPRNWYQKISNLGINYTKETGYHEFDVMMNGDNLTPIPGCRQGKHIPILL